MKIKLLESANGMRKGDVRDVDEVTGNELIAKGVAVKVDWFGQAVDAEAHDALKQARERDAKQG